MDVRCVLGITRTLRRSPDIVHDTFPDTALVRSSITPFICECNTRLFTLVVAMRLSSFPQTNDPGVLDQVKTEICRAAALLADNYSDDFKPFAQQFALAIWSLLTRLNLSPSFDEVTVDEDLCR